MPSVISLAPQMTVPSPSPIERDGDARGNESRTQCPAAASSGGGSRWGGLDKTLETDHGCSPGKMYMLLAWFGWWVLPLTVTGGNGEPEPKTQRPSVRVYAVSAYR